MGNPSTDWLDFLSGRRHTRLQFADPDAPEYIPIVAMQRSDGVRVPVIKDEILLTETDRRAADLGTLLSGTHEVTDSDVDVGRMRYRADDSANVHDRVPPDVGTPSHVAVVGGRIKNRPTPETAREAPLPADGNVPADAPVAVVIDTGLAAASVGRSRSPESNRDDPWLNRLELAGDRARHIDRLDVLEPEGLDIGAGHGTFVAGIIGQVTPARIVMIRAFDTDGIGSERAIARAIRQAGTLLKNESAERGVLNLSFGIETVNDDEVKVLRDALDALPPEVVVVAAAGNDATGRPFWPAASERVLGIAALEKELLPAEWSNFGPWVDFSAQGVDLVAPYVAGTETRGTGKAGDPFDIEPDVFDGPNPYASWEGTSFSTALVTGAVANLLLEQPGLSRTQVRSELERLAVGPHIDGFGYPLSVLQPTS